MASISSASQTALSPATSTAAASASRVLSSAFAAHPAIVGSGWIFTSIVFSTYYTTEFLKYGVQSKIDEDDLGNSLIPTSSRNDFQQRQRQQRMAAKTSLSSTVTSALLVEELDPQRKLLPHQSNTIRAKLVSMLSRISRPKLLTLYRFSGSLLLGIFVHPEILKFHERLLETIHYMGDFALSAVFLFTANYCNSIALDKIGISLTYTSKCLIPLITVLLTFLVDGWHALPSVTALLMLIPIASGVALASWNSPKFEKSGFAAALFSSTAQAALNVSSKRALLKTGLSGLQAQRSMASVALIIAFGMTVHHFLGFAHCFGRQKENDDEEKTMMQNMEQIQMLPPPWVSLSAVVSYHYEYVLSFLFLKMVTPIGYGTCDAVRRLGIIVAGRKFFGGEPFSLINYGGIGMALLGAMGYSIASSH